MAYTDRVHGDLKPIANFDTPAYTVGSVNAVTSAATVQPQGPKLDFATITFDGHATGASVNAAITALTQLATVHLYEFTTGGSNDTLAVAFYPIGAWGDVTLTGAGTLDQAVTDAVGSAVTVAASATFTG
jgi:hypothetical protein